ncbi:transposase [Mucilaginibacter sp. P25]
MDKKKSSRRVYDADFRSDVLKMVFSGRSVVDVAASLGIRENLIHKWKSRYKETTGSSALKSPGSETPIVSVEEYERMKVRLREVEQERDILKKALGIFSRTT